MSTNPTTYDNDINNVGFDPEEPQFDLGTFDPTERRFPVQPRPGTNTFTFYLRENDPFEVIEKKQQGIVVGKTLRINYELGFEIERKDGSGSFEKRLKFLSTDFYQTPKMREKNMPAEGVKLLKALGYEGKKGDALSQDGIESFLRGVDGRAQLKVSHGIRYYDKEAKVETTTHPRKGNDKQQQWPKDAEGQFVNYVTNSAGEEVAGNFFVRDFYAQKH
jgi:hypothetical protein